MDPPQPKRDQHLLEHEQISFTLYEQVYDPIEPLFPVNFAVTQIEHPQIHMQEKDRRCSNG
jgi:hypothetical protein